MELAQVLSSVKVETVSTADNLLRGARMLGEKDGFAGAFTDSVLTDGDPATRWEKPDFNGDRSPYAVWDLGTWKSLTGVTLLGGSVHWDEGFYPGGWDLLVSADGKAWTTAVSCRNVAHVTASFSFPQVSARYVMLRLAERATPGKAASIREFMVFGPDAVPADRTAVSTRTVGGEKWTGRSANGTPDGYGRSEGADGVYIGSFLRGERQGQGILYQKDGSVLEGRWIHGALYGPGRLTRPDGSRVIGTWVNGQLNGTAWEVKTDGSVLEQTWEYGTRTRSGPMVRTTWKSGSYTFEGYCIRGQAEGNCRRTSESGVHEGLFCEGTPLGQGTRTYSKTGNTMSGVWYPGDICEGTLRKSDGTTRPARSVAGKYYFS